MAVPPSGPVGGSNESTTAKNRKDPFMYFLSEQEVLTTSSHAGKFERNPKVFKEVLLLSQLHR